eukprot:scaffold10416_cov32-Tisochrysis_lutea.AAC.6
MPSRPTPAPSSRTRSGPFPPRRLSNASIPRRSSSASHSRVSSLRETGQTFIPVKSARRAPVRGCGTGLSKKCWRT